MPHRGIVAPATFRRAFFVFILGCTIASRAIGAGPPSAPPDLAQVGKPDPIEAARLIEQFRRSGIPGQYYLEFNLRAMPRRGEERVFKGRLWGGRNDQGAVTRAEVVDANGATHRFLVQNGPNATVWHVENGRVAPLDVAALMKPLIPGVEVTAFDVQMPFLYWPDPIVEKIARVLGRPTHAFLFRAPAAFTAQYGEVTAARAYLDTQFNQLLQTELIGPTGRVVKSFAFVSLKKVGDQYVPKAADYRNEVTRDKTRLEVTGVALHLSLPGKAFDSASLTETLPPPAADQIARIDP